MGLDGVLKLCERIFKTRGFCLESTHFTDLERLSKLCSSINSGAMLGIPHRAMAPPDQTPQTQEAWA